MANEVSTTEGKKSLMVAANRIADVYISDISNLNAAVGVPMTDETKRCAVNVILSLCGEIGAAEVAKLPKDQVVQVLQFVTVNGLDIFNGQVFLDKRKDRSGNIVSIKATPMGSAFEIMTRRFGVNVKTIHPARIVHEGDEFELPQFDGLKMTNVKLKPSLKGLDSKAIAVYYIIEKNDGTLDFAIATREGVGKNLMAQILNASLRDDSVNRGELMKHLEGKSLDEILVDPFLAKWISPAYRSPASRESMILTKMKKNALMHYTRDLGASQNTAFAKVNAAVVDDDSDMVVSYQDTSTETTKPIPEKAKIKDFDVDDDGVVEEAPKTPKAPAKPAPKPVEEAVEVKPTEPAPAPAEEVAEEPKGEPVKVSIFDDDIDDL